MAGKTKHKVGDICSVRPEWEPNAPELVNIKVKVVAIQHNGTQIFYKVKWNETDAHLESNYGFLFAAKELK